MKRAITRNYSSIVDETNDIKLSSFNMRAKKMNWDISSNLCTVYYCTRKIIH